MCCRPQKEQIQYTVSARSGLKPNVDLQTSWGHVMPCLSYVSCHVMRCGVTFNVSGLQQFLPGLLGPSLLRSFPGCFVCLTTWNNMILNSRMMASLMTNLTSANTHNSHIINMVQACNKASNMQAAQYKNTPRKGADKRANLAQASPHNLGNWRHLTLSGSFAFCL